jgi:hypothetical protein
MDAANRLFGGPKDIYIDGRQPEPSDTPPRDSIELHVDPVPARSTAEKCKQWAGGLTGDCECGRLTVGFRVFLAGIGVLWLARLAEGEYVIK